MKKRNLFGFLNKKAEDDKPIVTVHGITTGEYYDITHAIEAEFGVAAERQRPGAKEPSAYMKGLLFALGAIKAVRPHELEVQ